MYNQEFKKTEIRYLQSHGDHVTGKPFAAPYVTTAPCHLQMTATNQHKKYYNHRPGDQYT